MENGLLADVKKRVWFYEFELPDGTVTQTNIASDILRIHTSRRAKLRRVIADKVPDSKRLTAIDFASHEGYFSVELARHFAGVHGFEFRPESIAAARLVCEALGLRNVTFTQADLQTMGFVATLSADFVLVYGLIYHLENPIHVLRLASQLARKHILVETQVFPYDVSGRLEDGHYSWQRQVQGVFSLSADYPKEREGGSTDLALVPSLNALLFLLKTFGFQKIDVIAPEPDDYEQFQRGSRVVVYGRK
jgi:ubiquinone/menaquinone biosynthesis C-methylase UbiE